MYGEIKLKDTLMNENLVRRFEESTKLKAAIKNMMIEHQRDMDDIWAEVFSYFPELKNDKLSCVICTTENNEAKRFRIVIEGADNELIPKLEHIALTDSGNDKYEIRFEQIRSEES